METKRIEGLWDCPSCDTVGIKARFDECPNCGRPRGIETLFYLPDDLKAATLSEEEAKRTTNEPDWLCEFCGGYNSSADSVCEGCGAPRDKTSKTYGMLHKLTGKLFKRNSLEK